MDQQNRIKKIIAITNCSYDQAIEADKESNGDINLAFKIAKNKSNELYVGGGSSGLAVDSRENKNEIVGYKDGLLVNNKFYSYKEEKNIKLKKMLENNEFDANILGVDDTKAEVVYKNCENENYETEEIKPKTYDNNKKHVLSFDSKLNMTCPDEIIMDEEGDVKFKILVDGRRILVKMNKEMKISDFYNKLKEYTNKKVVLTKGDKKIMSNDDISILERNMFILKEEK